MMLQQNNKSYSISVENILYSSFVKMNKLDELTYNTFSGTSISSATELNIFIDLYSVLKPFFSDSYISIINDQTAIVSGVVNMCSHYRTFFKGLGVSTKFFIVHSYNTCELNRKFVAGYNETFKNKSEIPLFRKNAEVNMELLELLCPYLPDIHFIRSKEKNYEVGVIIANLIEQYGNNIPNLIISRDLYPLQLCAMYPYVSYLHPIKYKGEDRSIMVPLSEKENFREMFWKLANRFRRTKIDNILPYSPKNYMLICSMNGFPERSIPVLSNIQVVMRIIDKIVGTEDIKIVIDQLYNDAEISSLISVPRVESIYKSLDIGYLLPYYKEDPESIISLTNLDDPATLNSINAKFFQNDPLQLQRL